MQDSKERRAPDRAKGKGNRWRIPEEYIASAPQLPSVIALKFESGMQDSFVNLAEMALRKFEQGFPAIVGDKLALERACREVLLPPTAGDWNNARQNASKYSLAQVGAVADTFFREVTREYRAYRPSPGVPWTSTDSKGEQLDALNRLIENLPRDIATQIRKCPEYDIMELLRKMRNRVLHSTNNDTDKDRDAIVANHGYHLECTYQATPSRFNSIGYPDFLLCTRALKLFSTYLSNRLAITGTEIAQFALNDPEFVSAIRKVRTRARVADTFALSLAQQFRMPLTDKQHATRVLKEFLATDLISRDRRRLKKKAT